MNTEHIVQSSAGPDQEADVEDSLDDDCDVLSHANTSHQWTQIVKYLKTGKRGELAKKHLHQQQRSAHDDHEDDVDTEEGDSTTADDGEGQEEERMMVESH